MVLKAQCFGGQKPSSMNCTGASLRHACLLITANYQADKEDESTNLSESPVRVRELVLQTHFSL